MKFQVGDKVRIKPLSEILTFKRGEYLGGFTTEKEGKRNYFNNRMKEFCGQEDEIKDFNGNYYLLKNTPWNWRYYWLEPVGGETKFFKKDDYEIGFVGKEIFFSDLKNLKCVKVKSIEKMKKDIKENGFVEEDGEKITVNFSEIKELLKEIK